MLATIGFALLAGIFSTLSPCVLPLVPLVLGAAVSEHRFGPAALAGGLALSFTSVGLFVATIGFAAGIDAWIFRAAAAILLAGIGIVLIVPRFQHNLPWRRVPSATGPNSVWADFRQRGFQDSSRLDFCWASFGRLASGRRLARPPSWPREGRIGQVAATMLVFGVGAALPLLVLGMVSRETMMRMRGRLMATGRGAKVIMGSVLITMGLVILSGLDRSLETILNASPAWLTNLTTHF